MLLGPGEDKRGVRRWGWDGKAVWKNCLLEWGDKGMTRIPLEQHYKSSTNFGSAGYSFWPWDSVRETGFVLLVPCYLRNKRRCQRCAKTWDMYRCPPGLVWGWRQMEPQCVWQYTLLWACGDLNGDSTWNYCCTSNPLGVGSCRLRSHVLGHHLSGPCRLSHHHGSCATPQWI